MLLNKYKSGLLCRRLHSPRLQQGPLCFISFSRFFYFFLSYALVDEKLHYIYYINYLSIAYAVLARASYVNVVSHRTFSIWCSMYRPMRDCCKIMFESSCVLYILYSFSFFSTNSVVKNEISSNPVDILACVTMFNKTSMN